MAGTPVSVRIPLALASKEPRLLSKQSHRPLSIPSVLVRSQDYHQGRHASLSCGSSRSKGTAPSQGLHLSGLELRVVWFQKAILILRAFLAAELYPCLLLLQVVANSMSWWLNEFNFWKTTNAARPWGRWMAYPILSVLKPPCWGPMVTAVCVVIYAYLDFLKNKTEDWKMLSRVNSVLKNVLWSWQRRCLITNINTQASHITHMYVWIYVHVHYVWCSDKLSSYCSVRL